MTGQSPFDQSPVQAGLAGTRFADGFTHLQSVGSTNALALEAAAAGARSGVWMADEQTAGRGRGGHTWYSAPGDGLYVSALVAPRLPITTALKIALATGLAAQRAVLGKTGLRVDLRWPNDLVIDGRKCGGILVETAVEPARETRDAMLRYAVIGIGMNLNHSAFPPELSSIATSLRRERGRKVERDALLVALLRALDDELGMLERESADEKAGSLLTRFAGASSWVLGKRVSVDELYTGTTAGLSPEGFLRVTGDDGSVRIVRSGGVREASEPQP